MMDTKSQHSLVSKRLVLVSLAKSRHGGKLGLPKLIIDFQRLRIHNRSNLTL